LKKYGTLIPYSNDNTLIDEDKVYDTYARYFLDVVKVFRSRGLTIDYITLQNEPLFGDSKEYPGMYLSSDNERRLAQYVRKYFAQESVQLLAYDHNWDHPEYPIGAIQSNSDPVFDGIAWHCYGGDMATAHETAHRVLPDKVQHVTECTGSFPDDTCDISKGMSGFGYNHEWDMSNILLGATSHWAVSGIKWILALDEHCGPTLPDVGYKNGRPLVSIPSTVTSESDIKYNQDYWSIGHMSRFIPRGSYRISSSIAGGGKSSLISETFVDAKSGKMSMLVLNSDHSNAVEIAVSMNHETIFTDNLPPFSTKVYQWDL
jgi:glucosylceramidase